MKINRISLLSFFLPLFCISQTLKGRVIDKITQQPIETVAVYFNNTTIGTTTNEKGEFSISYTDAVQSNLVFSYLGYQMVLISDYRTKNDITLELIEVNVALSPVHIDYDDGLTRNQKLRLFRKEFLGTSKFGKSCKILNEDDLVLKYDKKNKALYVSSKVPIKVKNRVLKYEIAFDIIDFEVSYRYVEATTKTFTVNSVTYLGTSFYKNLKGFEKKKTIKNRKLAYKGSVQHFMRSLFNGNIVEEGYTIYYKSFRVKAWDYFMVETIENSDFKKVTVSDKVAILYDNKFQSGLELEVDAFFVDTYGNYTPIIGVYFSGAMGSQRIGDTLPSDYGL